MVPVPWTKMKNHPTMSEGKKNLEIHKKLPWIYNKSRRVDIHKSKETCKIAKNQISLDNHLALRLKNMHAYTGPPNPTLGQIKAGIKSLTY